MNISLHDVEKITIKKTRVRAIDNCPDHNVAVLTVLTEKGEVDISLFNMNNLEYNFEIEDK